MVGASSIVQGTWDKLHMYVHTLAVWQEIRPFKMPPSQTQCYTYVRILCLSMLLYTFTCVGATHISPSAFGHGEPKQIDVCISVQ